MEISNLIQSRNTISARKKNSLLELINSWIKKEEKNAIGIAILFIMVGTMIASISAALAIQDEIAYFPLIFTCLSAMGANVMAISQQSFKIITWAFIINILGNLLLIIYQLKAYF